MKTRTLLLMALVCGVGILLAGGLMLMQLTGGNDLVAASPISQVVPVGDMRVTVAHVSEANGVLVVEVQIGGVDDADGAAGFRLIAAGRQALRVPGAPGCESATVADQVCELRFDVASADGTSRMLFYERGDDRARWILDQP